MELKKYARTVFTVVLFSTSASFARVPFFSRSRHVETPQLFEQLTINFGNAVSETTLPGPTLKVFVWNVHKAKDPQLVEDFKTYSADVDLAMFQEAISLRQFSNRLVDANPSLGWTLAKSFSMSEESYTGVATGSRYVPAKEEVIVSIPTEPVSNTHKTILLSQFFVAFQAEPLLVANIHAINFVGTRDFRIQIQQLLARVQEHRGPLLIGGDFNTWNPLRLSYLKSAFGQMGLKLVYSPKCRLFNLDHIFVRGMSLSRVTNLEHIRSSDHAPMKVELRFDPPTGPQLRNRGLSNSERPKLSSIESVL